MTQQYIRRLEKIEAVLREVLPEEPDLSWTARFFLTGPRAGGPGDTALGKAVQFLTQPGRELLSRGGKRWRPLLMALVCESLGGGDAALPLAPLVEFPHNASLIHDDIEDNSEERRGKPAVHLLYGTDTAINGGCFFYFLPLACVETWDAPAERKNAVYALWSAYMRRLHLGQAMDISWHRDFFSLPSPEEYYTMCRMKTGCLAGLAAVLGVQAAFAGKNRPDPEKEGALREMAGEAAEKLGVGFQILDDVKNLTTGIPGKKRGDDLVEGKKSLPVLLYLRGHEDRRELTARCFSAARSQGCSAPEVEEFIGELSRAGVLDEAEHQGRTMIKEAAELFSGAFRGLPGDRDARNLLTDLTNYLAG
ncbi:MAG: polyprenyl synthetase family protein [Spirochaetaceae bacterium]|jgi:octaprenyl-diphosphate synthase|nr:polyprenyl synthetase family protein [Spirochaetaceae bacterium]